MTSASVLKTWPIDKVDEIESCPQSNKKIPNPNFKIKDEIKAADDAGMLIWKAPANKEKNWDQTTTKQVDKSVFPHSNATFLPKK